MAERAYNLTNVNIHRMRHANFVTTLISSDVTLNNDSPQLLFLDPVNQNLNVMMPDAIFCGGIFYWIENTSLGTGCLRIWDNTHSNLIGTIYPGYRATIISDGVYWRISIEATSFAYATIRRDGDIQATEWTLNNAGRPAGSDWYYAILNHGIGSKYVQVQTANIDTKDLFLPAEIDYIDTRNVRLWVNSPVNTRVMIASTPTANDKTVNSADWILDNTGRPAGSSWYYNDISHSVNSQYMLIQTADIHNDTQFIPAEIDYFNSTTVRVWVNNMMDTKIIVAGEPLTVSTLGSLPLIHTADWTLDNTGKPAGIDWYYVDVYHGVGKDYVMIQTVDNDTNEMIIPVDVHYTDNNNVRIWSNVQMNMRVII